MEIITQKNALGLQNLGLLWHVAEWQRMATAGEVLTKKGTKYSATSVIAINKLNNWLGQYQASKVRTLNIPDICRHFAKDFEIFLSSKEISLNYKFLGDLNQLSDNEVIVHTGISSMVTRCSNKLDRIYVLDYD